MPGSIMTREVHMIQTLSRNWFLLALCGVLDAVISVIYLMMLNTHGPLTVGAVGGTVVFLGEVTLAAGICSIAGGIWRSGRAEFWPLLLNGLALGALGLIYCFFVRHYRISIRTIALLILLMAMSIGILEAVNARTLRQQHRAVRGWFLGLAGAAAVGCALVFSAVGFRWIEMRADSRLDLLWLSFYFGFSALCMLGLALRPAPPGRPGIRQEGSLSPI
jgi:uncharacterized membrane protein HdeD (DUF308 family)